MWLFMTTETLLKVRQFKKMLTLIKAVFRNKLPKRLFRMKDLLLNRAASVAVNCFVLSAELQQPHNSQPQLVS